MACRTRWIIMGHGTSPTRKPGLFLFGTMSSLAAWLWGAGAGGGGGGGGGGNHNASGTEGQHGEGHAHDKGAGDEGDKAAHPEHGGGEKGGVAGHPIGGVDKGLSTAGVNGGGNGGVNESLGITAEFKEFVKGISQSPSTWTSFPVVYQAIKEFKLSRLQEEHALEVLSEVPMLQRIRYQI